MTLQPYFEDESIQIFCGDCREVLAGLRGDLTCTDPPYGVGKAEWDEEYPTFWIEPAFAATPRILCMPGNSALMKAGAAFGEAYRDTIALYAVNGMTRSKIAFGNWIPVIAAGEWKWEARPNLLKFVVDTNEEEIDHPSPKPLQAMEKLLSKYSKPGWTVIDPFMGSGTTLRAAKNLGMKAIGIEVKESYCEIAVRRLSQEVMVF